MSRTSPRTAPRRRAHQGRWFLTVWLVVGVSFTTIDSAIEGRPAARIAPGVLMGFLAAMIVMMQFGIRRPPILCHPDRTSSTLTIRRAFVVSCGLSLAILFLGTLLITRSIATAVLVGVGLAIVPAAIITGLHCHQVFGRTWRQP